MLATASSSSPNKLRKSPRPPPTAFHLPHHASSTAIARATAMRFIHDSSLHDAPVSRSTSRNVLIKPRPSSSVSPRRSFTFPPNHMPPSSATPAFHSIPVLSQEPEAFLFPPSSELTSTPPKIPQLLLTDSIHPSYVNTSVVVVSHHAPNSISFSPRSQRRRQSGTNLMRRWSLLDIPDEELAVEFEHVRRVTIMRERRKCFRPNSENCIQQPISSTEDASNTLGSFVYGGPHKFWLGGDQEHENGVSDVDSEYEADENLDLLQGGEEQPDDKGWNRTRRALFCCRELVRTEHTYFARLIQLFEGRTSTQPPTLIMAYLPALIAASNTLMENFARDPTAYGISKAFVDAGSLLENALVAYCGVIGAVFANKRSERRKLVRSARQNSLIIGGMLTGHFTKCSKLTIAEELSTLQQTECGERICIGSSSLEPMPEVFSSPQTDQKEPSGYVRKLKRTLSLFKRKSLPLTSSIAFLGKSQSNPTSPRSSRIFSFDSVVQRSSSINLGRLVMTPHVPSSESSPSPVTPQDTHRYLMSEPVIHSDTILEDWPIRSGGYVGSSSTHGYASSSSHDHSRGPGEEKISTARDLAILPTQRATRFVLLYRDLLSYTPENSPTRLLVERALGVATRIANKCDRAQGNAAFLRKA